MTVPKHDDVNQSDGKLVEEVVRVLVEGEFNRKNEAFNILWRRYEKLIVKAIEQVLWNLRPQTLHKPSIIEDIKWEIYFALPGKILSQTQRGPLQYFQAWLTRITYHTAIDAWKRISRRTIATVPECPDTWNEFRSIGWWQSTEFLPADIQLERQDRNRIQKLAAVLLWQHATRSDRSLRSAIAIRLKFWENLRVKGDIDQILNRSERDIYRLLAEDYTKLNESLGKLGIKKEDY